MCGFYGRRPPPVFAQTNSVKPNASLTKIRHLVEHFPDFLDKNVSKVGISDTSHGEDFYWLTAFTTLVDVNSPNPYTPIIPENSPLQTLISCKIGPRKIFDWSPIRVESGKCEAFHEMDSNELEKELQDELELSQNMFSQYLNCIECKEKTVNEIVEMSRKKVPRHFRDDP